MDTSRERDESIERLLRQSLKAPRHGDGTDMCLDAEALAAWADGSLSGAALELAQSHVAECDRCQSLVGAMSRANAAAPQTPPPRAAARWLGWLVPLTAAAAALALWVAVPREKYVSVLSPPSVENAPTQAAAADARQPEAPGVQPEAPVEGNRQQAARTASTVAQDQPAAAAPELRKDRNDTATGQDQAAGRLEVDALKEEQKSAPAAPAPSRAVAGASSQPAREADAAPLRERVQTNAVGQTCGPAWSAAPSDIAARLTAGAAPSTAVCWLVGRGGTIVVSIDEGRTWRRVTFPEITDLSAVRATDARSASVSTADGRTFNTSDGGATWVRP